MRTTPAIVANDNLVRIRDRTAFADGATIETGAECIIVAIGYLEVMEVWLFLCGRPDWTWADARQQRRRRYPLVVARVCLLHDAVPALLPYALHTLRIRLTPRRELEQIAHRVLDNVSLVAYTARCRALYRDPVQASA